MTKCEKIHALDFQDQEPVIFNSKGQPIGPNDQILNEFSFFLGTLGRNSQYCPLIHTNWKALPKNNIIDMWKYVNV